MTAQNVCSENGLWAHLFEQKILALIDSKSRHYKTQLNILVYFRLPHDMILFIETAKASFFFLLYTALSMIKNINSCRMTTMTLHWEVKSHCSKFSIQLLFSEAWFTVCTYTHPFHSAHHILVGFTKYNLNHLNRLLCLWSKYSILADAVVSWKQNVLMAGFVRYILRK